MTRTQTAMLAKQRRQFSKRERALFIMGQIQHALTLGDLLKKADPETREQEKMLNAVVQLCEGRAAALRKHLRKIPCVSLDSG